MNKKRDKKSFLPFRKNPWIISPIVLLLVFLFLVSSSNFKRESQISKEEVAIKASSFVNSQLPEKAEVVNVTSENCLYKVTLSYQEDYFPVYITLDGKNFVQGIKPLE